MRGTLFALLALWAATGAAQTTYKCTDEQKRVTYTNAPCDKQGLRDEVETVQRGTQAKPIVPLVEKLSK